MTKRSIKRAEQRALEVGISVCKKTFLTDGQDAPSIQVVQEFYGSNGAESLLQNTGHLNPADKIQAQASALSRC